MLRQVGAGHSNALTLHVKDSWDIIMVIFDITHTSDNPVRSVLTDTPAIFPHSPPLTSVVMMKHSYIRSFHASYRSNLFQIVIERHILPWMSEQLAQSRRLFLLNFTLKSLTCGNTDLYALTACCLKHNTLTLEYALPSCIKHAFFHDM
jgi:hypothetical protein